MSNETKIVIEEKNLKASNESNVGGEIAVVFPAIMGRTDKVYTVYTVEEFENIFSTSPSLPYRECKYLLNRGNVLKVVRTPLTDVTQVKATAEVTLADESTDSLNIEAVSAGSAYNGIKVQLTNQGGSGNNNVFSATVLKGTKVLEAFPIVSLNPDSEYYFDITVNSDIVLFKMATFTSGDAVFSGSDPIGTVKNAILADGEGDTVGTSDAAYKSALAYLKNKDIHFATLLVLDKPASSVITYLTDTNVKLFDRQDFVALLELDATSASAALTEVAGFNTSYAATFYPKGKTTSFGSATKTSIALADLIGAMHRENKFFKAPAGLENGVLTDWIDVVQDLTDAEISNLQNSVVNPIIVKNNVGCVVWDQHTLAKSKSDITELSVRLLANYLKRAIYDISQKYIFADNNAITWGKWVDEVTPVIRDIANVNGLQKYKVVCDRTIMSDQDITNGIMRGQVYFTPNKQIRQVYITFVIDETGVSFE